MSHIKSNIFDLIRELMKNYEGKVALYGMNKPIVTNQPIQVLDIMGCGLFVIGGKRVTRAVVTATLREELKGHYPDEELVINFQFTPWLNRWYCDHTLMVGTGADKTRIVLTTPRREGGVDFFKEETPRYTNTGNDAISVFNAVKELDPQCAINVLGKTYSHPIIVRKSPYHTYKEIDASYHNLRDAIELALVGDNPLYLSVYQVKRFTLNVKFGANNDVEGQINFIWNDEVKAWFCNGMVASYYKESMWSSKGKMVYALYPTI